METRLEDLFAASQAVPPNHADRAAGPSAGDLCAEQTGATTSAGLPVLDFLHEIDEPVRAVGTQPASIVAVVALPPKTKTKCQGYATIDKFNIYMTSKCSS